MEQISSGLAIVGLIGLFLIAARKTLLALQHKKRQKHWRNQAEMEAMPPELANMTVIGAEVPIRTGRRTPVRIHGRADLILRNAQDELVVLETKTRNQHRTYFSDTVQLSCYAYCLRHGRTPRKTSPFGWVRIVNRKTGEVKYKKVRLLDEERLKRIYDRYLAVKSGQEQPICTCGGRLCQPETG